MKVYRLLALFVLAVPAWADDSRGDAQSVIYLGENGIVVLKLQIRVGGKSPQQFFEQYVDQLMKSCDTNNDGIVTVDEAKGKYLTAREASQAQLTPQSEAVAPDTSPDVSPADGKITRTEFLTYFRRIGLQPFIMLYQPNSQQAVGNRGRRQAVVNGDVPLFARLDINNDGKLSSQELTGALRTLRKLDLDDDETISAAELSPLANQNVVQQPPQGNAQPASTSPFLGIGSDESVSKQIRRLIEKYDSKDAIKSGVEGSKVRNQKLSAQELGVSIASVASFDSDGDGQLDFDELRQFLALPESMIGISINLDTAEPLKAESSFEQFQDKLRTSPDGAANINLGTTQLSINRGVTNDFGGAEAFLKPQFMAADADANGYLEKSETERAFLFGATFEDLDTDKNGKVFLDEAVAYFRTRFDAARSRTVLTINEQGRTLFDILDTDRDRRLSFRELQTAAGKLALWDRDGDGMLSESEVPQQYRMTVARGNLPALGGNFIANNMNQTGDLAERTSGPIWFRKMDKNRDGEVSYREFLGDLAIFERLDANHDGFIDLTESVHNIPE